jgi:hypothetical protein
MSNIVVACLPWPFNEAEPNPEIAERQALVEERRRGSENRLAQERWRQTFRSRKCPPFVATFASREEYAELKYTSVSLSILDVAHLDPASRLIIRFLEPIAYGDRRYDTALRWGRTSDAKPIFLELENRWAAGDSHIVRDEFPLRRPS